MPIDHTNAGEIASSSYNNNKKQNETAAKYGYTIDGNLSKGNTRVWRKEGEKSVIVHRGSKTLGDWRDDALISLGLGKRTHRYRNAQRVTKRVREADGGQGAIHVGHSLGGYLAEHSAAKNQDTAFTYNKHAFGLQGSVKNKNQTDVRTPGDIASAQAALFGNKNERAHKKVTEGKSGMYAPLHRNTLLNPLYAHKTTRKSLYKS